VYDDVRQPRLGGGVKVRRRFVDPEWALVAHAILSMTNAPVQLWDVTKYSQARETRLLFGMSVLGDHIKFALFVPSEYHNVNLILHRRIPSLGTARMSMSNFSWMPKRCSLQTNHHSWKQPHNNTYHTDESSGTAMIVIRFPCNGTMFGFFLCYSEGSKGRLF
jgi:hypothetical protein